MFLTVVGVCIVLVWVYILFVRPYVLGAFPMLYDIEKSLYSNSRTMLTGIGLKLGGLAMAVHEFLVAQGYDETSIFTQVQNIIPEQYQPYAPILLGLLLVLIGQAMTWLRKNTDTALEDK